MLIARTNNRKEANSVERLFDRERIPYDIVNMGSYIYIDSSQPQKAKTALKMAGLVKGYGINPILETLGTSLLTGAGLGAGYLGVKKFIEKKWGKNPIKKDYMLFYSTYDKREARTTLSKLKENNFKAYIKIKYSYPVNVYNVYYKPDFDDLDFHDRFKKSAEHLHKSSSNPIKGKYTCHICREKVPYAEWDAHMYHHMAAKHNPAPKGYWGGRSRDYWSGSSVEHKAEKSGKRDSEKESWADFLGVKKHQRASGGKYTYRNPTIITLDKNHKCSACHKTIKSGESAKMWDYSDKKMYYHTYDCRHIENPLLNVSDELISYLKRIKGDRKAGHNDALDYWEGAAAGALVAENRNPLTNKEYIKFHTKIAKSLLGSQVQMSDDGFRWYKSGGYADKKIKDTLSKLKKLNFQEVGYKEANVPDGSRMGNSRFFRNNEGDRFILSSSYGETSYNNHFSMWYSPLDLKRIYRSIS